MSNETIEILRIYQSNLGSERCSCDDGGKKMWDRIEAALASHDTAVSHADALEKVLMEIVNGKRKADRIPMEPMVRLIAYARTGSCAKASIKGDE